MLTTCQLHCTSRCENRCRYCLVRSPSPGDADFSNVVSILYQLDRIGVPYVDFTGGNPLLCDWLPDAIRLSNRLGLFSSLTVSGPLITKRGEEFISLPYILRFSIDGTEQYHDQNRGPGFFRHLVNGLEMARELRQGKPTQLIFTVVPGIGGNIRQDVLDSVLSFARDHQVLINVNPVFSTPLSEEEIDLLLWFAGHAGVQMSKGKLRLISDGGNSVRRPTCRAVSSVIAISPDNRLCMPCFHNTVDSVSLGKMSLRDALNSPARIMSKHQQGRYDFCEGCTIWCYIMPSLISAPVTAIAWMHSLSFMQPLRDWTLRFAGGFHPDHPYPSFSPRA